MFALMALGVAGVHAACEKPVPSHDFAQIISQGDAAFADMDDAGFMQARAEANRELSCLSDGLNSTQAAAYYRLQALGAFMDRDHAGAVGCFRSLLAVAPGYDLPESLAPDGHPLRLYFEIAEGMNPVPAKLLPEPRKGWVQIDGKTTREAPIDRPYLFQYFDDSGAVAASRLVTPGLAPPEYPARASHEGGSASVNMPLLATAGVAAVAAGGLYFWADHEADRFWDPGTPQADLGRLRSRANTLGWISASAGVVAVGSGAAAMVVGRF